VPESDDRLQAAVLVGGGAAGEPGALVTIHLHHAASRVTLHDLDGSVRGPVPLDDVAGPLVTAGGLYGDGVGASRSSTALHLTVESFTSPAAVVHLDVAEPDATPSVAWAPGFPPTTPDGVDLVTERVFVVSGDADRPVRVPLFVVRRADVTPDGARPTVLWGYGGFGIAVTPAHRSAWRAWVEHGGVLAVACLRGGGEYGQAWHDDGRLAAKQHVFDDAIACAGWLTGRDGVVAEDLDGTVLAPPAPWTSPAHLGVEGRSNGGLLVGALLTQRPDLFASAVPEVGVLDLLRFHLFTIGWAWTSDYGDPAVADDAAAALTWSPLHRLVPGTAYPATLVTTGDTDDRVVPSHSYKFAAALWEAQAGDAPVALRVDVAAGHGAGKPTSKLVAERADVLAWHAHHTGLDLDPGTEVRDGRHSGA
jgi:prolyl oligopeptidase